MSWMKRVLFAGALTTVALAAPACMGHNQAAEGTGGSGRQHCELFHADSYGENHPTPMEPGEPGVQHDGDVICQ